MFLAKLSLDKTQEMKEKAEQTLEMQKNIMKTKLGFSGTKEKPKLYFSFLLSFHFLYSLCLEFSRVLFKL